jgi:putative chitinase
MDLTKLQGILPDFIYNELQEVTSAYGIGTQNRMANFLGQCDHESAGFKVFIENLNYSGQALWSRFSSHFASADEANSYARQPERIANRIYANRMGNGDEASGDGWKYRGKGCIQLTGKTNHMAFFTAIGLDPENTDPMILTKEYALISAAWFWGGKKLNAIADAGTDNATITKISKLVNGGTIGLNERIAKTQKYFDLLA